MNKNGMTLIEVMIVVAIIAIGATIAIPNYQQWVAKENIRDGVVNLKGALQIAKVTAMSRGVPVAVMLNAPVVNQYQVFVDDGVGAGGVRGDGVQNGAEVFLSPPGRMDPANQNTQIFNSGITFFSSNALSIEFLSSGRRSRPLNGDQANGDQRITLQNNDFGLERTIDVSAFGDIR